jgi:hypothetical protein
MLTSTRFSCCLPQFICGEVHSVEVGEDITSLDILSDELELAERSLGVVVVLQIGQRNFKHATLQTVGSDSGTLGTIDQGLADLASSEH